MKIKKIFSIVLTLLLSIMIVIPTSVGALMPDEYEKEGYVFLDRDTSQDHGGYYMCGYRGEEKELIIPDELNITVMKSFRYSNNTVEVLTLPSTLKEMDKGVIRNFKKIKKVIIPKDLDFKFDGWKFNSKTLEEIIVEEGHSSLCAVDGVLYNKDKTELICYPGGKNKNVEISEGITKIGYGAFFKSPIESIKLPKTLRVIGHSAFRQCDNLNKIDFSEGLEEIRKNAFYSCTSLEEIHLPQTVKEISNAAFFNCRALGTVELNEGLKTIDGYVFFQCFSLKSIEIPQTVTKLNGAFHTCTNLSSVTLPNGLKSIGARTFFRCKNLKKIDLPTSVTSIGARAFEQSGLETITLPKNVKILYSYAFRKCTNLKNVKFMGEVNTISESAFGNCGQLETVEFRKGYLNSIGKNAFYSCRSLKEITISNTKNAPKFHKKAFDGCGEGIKFYVVNNTVAKKLKAKLQKTNIKKAKIYRSTPILIYKNVG